MTPATLPVFVTVMFLLNITPGPDMLYVMARATGQRRAAGLASALGVGAGCFFHISAVAFGLAGLLRTVPVAGNALRLAGAAYLIYLGARTLTARSDANEANEAAAVAPASLPRIFAQGIITNVLNPKVALFFLAVALAASSVDSALRNRIGSAPFFRWLTGGVFIGLGLRLAKRDA